MQTHGDSLSPFLFASKSFPTVKIFGFYLLSLERLSLSALASQPLSAANTSTTPGLVGAGLLSQPG